MEWKDVTSYSRDDKERTPRVWELKLAPRILVRVHKHIYYGDEWLVSCDFIGYNNRELDTSDVDIAKRVAIALVRDELVKLNATIADAILQTFNI